MRLSRAAALAILLSSTAVAPAAAGPPFLTDDPVPVDYRHHEFYVFGTLDRNQGGTTTVGPAFEYNIGAAPNVQLHVVAPFVTQDPSDDATERGLGDVETGVKWRFVQETATRPQVAVFPMAELPTGDSDRGLGNGRVWFRLPVWIQKSWGPWTSYGGGGYAVNQADGQRDYWFGGILVQRPVTDRLTLGGEIFSQGASVQVPGDATPTETPGGRSFVVANAGGYYAFNPEWSLLFSAGHSISGESHTVGYLGLYWTWGPK